MSITALQEYQRKVEAGEIIRTVALNPAEKALANPKSLRAAINAKCWDCTCGQRQEIKLCEMSDCSLHAHRPYQERT